MRINKICWKNIYSYGNKVEVLDFSGQGIWQLFGVSGAGKSSIIQMPQLLIYGKTMAKANKGDIANRTNKHGVIRGDISVGEDNYVITRKFDPDGLEIKKNGESMDFPTKIEAQSYIERVIMNSLPLDIYKNVLTLSLNNFKSFITISAADKRTIIDNIFSMDIVNKCNALLKEERKSVVSDINSINGGISVLDGQIFRTSNSIESKKSALKMSDEDASRETDIADALVKIDTKINGFVSKMSENQKETFRLTKEKETLNSDYIKMTEERKRCDEKIRLFKQDRCPTCGSLFNTEGFENLLKENEDLLNVIIKSLEEKTAEISAKIEEIKKIQLDSTNTSAEIQKLTDKRSKFIDWQNKIHEYNVAKMSISDTETELNRLKLERDTKHDTIAKKEAELDMYSLLESVYSDNGVKKYQREKYIPTLNKELKTSLEFINFPYQLSFDNDFNAKLKHRGETINIETLSAGERKKVDMCVLCSLIRIIKHKYPTINIIGLDETISSLDYESSVSVLKYLKRMSEELGVNILIVSHTTLDESLFDKRLFVDKIDGFSDIKFV